jgi:hypothetical protein
MQTIDHEQLGMSREEYKYEHGGLNESSQQHLAFDWTTEFSSTSLGPHQLANYNRFNR